MRTFYASEEDRKLGRDGLRDVSPKVLQWIYQVAPEGRTALCLSGGGIRSASFGLGVLQALAAHPRLPSTSADERAGKSLLAQFNYLSTVSGGGYIGGWFSAWVHRAGYQKVWKDLVRIAGRDQDPGEQAAPLRWLRVHSNFLTPTLGLSGDTMAGVAIVLRNLFLNWLVLLPVLCAVLIFMKLVALGVFFEWQQDWKAALVGSFADLVRSFRQRSNLHAWQPPEPDHGRRNLASRRPNPTSSFGACFHPASLRSPSRCFWQ